MDCSKLADYRRICVSRFSSASAASNRTLKASHNIAQGCREAATLGSGSRTTSQPQRACTMPRGTLTGFNGSPKLPPRVAAARQPWAILFNRFAVRRIHHDRNENSPIVRTSFPSFRAEFLAIQAGGEGGAKSDNGRLRFSRRTPEEVYRYLAECVQRERPDPQTGLRSEGEGMFAPLGLQESTGTQLCALTPAEQI